MKKVKAVIRKLLHPPKWVYFPVCPIVFALMIYFLATDTSYIAPAYAIYALSAYCMTVIVIPLPGLISKAKKTVYNKLEGFEPTARYLHGMSLRGNVSIYQGMTVNFFYAVFRVYVGIRYASVCTQHIIKEFLDFMPQDTVLFLEKMKSCPQDELYLVTPEYLTPYLEFIKAHKRIFRTSIEQASALKMDEAYTAMNRHIFFPILERFHVPSEDREYMMSYFMNGLVAIINDWLMGDCKDSTEQIIRIMQRCTLRPMKDTEGEKE